MSKVQEQQRAYQERLLVALRDELEARGVTSVLVVAQNGRPGLDVVDSAFRTRRVFVQLAFCWFYWGDQHDERVSSLHLINAVDRVAEAARQRWREGEQGELGIDLNKIVNAHRP